MLKHLSSSFNWAGVNLVLCLFCFVGLSLSCPPLPLNPEEPPPFIFDAADPGVDCWLTIDPGVEEAGTEPLARPCTSHIDVCRPAERMPDTTDELTDTPPPWWWCWSRPRALSSLWCRLMSSHKSLEDGGDDGAERWA